MIDNFRPLEAADVEPIREIFDRWNVYRTCDYTIGGLFMWADYFDYRYAIVDDTLFVLGVSEENMRQPAFSLPVGALPLQRSMTMLREYAASHELPLRLSAVPEPALEPLLSLGADRVDRLDDWSDYLYEIEPMTTYAGNKLAKKRNHVNRFMADHPDASFVELDDDNRQQALDFFMRQHLRADKSASADSERSQVIDVLSHPQMYGFEGAMLETPADGVVGFTMGEVVADTLHVHIEKMDHGVTGAGETLARDFATMMLRRHPGLRYVNREEDTGDEGLRQAKLSYHPVELLHKYDVCFNQQQ